MKKTLAALAAVMMMGGTIACAQQPEKNTTNDKTATEQPATEQKAEKAEGTCPEKCEKTGAQTESGQGSTAKPAEGTATNAK